MRKVLPFQGMRIVLAYPTVGCAGVSGQASPNGKTPVNHKVMGVPHKPGCTPKNHKEARGRPPAHSFVKTIQDEAVHELITKESYLQKSVHTFEKLTKLSSMYHKLLDQNIKNGIKLYISLFNSFQKVIIFKAHMLLFLARPMKRLSSPALLESPEALSHTWARLGDTAQGWGRGASPQCRTEW